VLADVGEEAMENRDVIIGIVTPVDLLSFITGPQEDSAVEI
jgi:hypothetical protein